MLNRRDLLKGVVAGGIECLARPSVAAPDMGRVHTALRQTVGTRENSAGMIAVIIDQAGARTETYGSSGAPNVPLDADAVFEIMSNTKVFTALLFADMVQRREVGLSDPVTRYLPVTLHQHSGPITLLDLATYTSGLPNMPGNLPSDWWAAPDPMNEYTEAKLYEFLSSYVPRYAPGTHYEYANLGFGLLGIALARRAGKSYDTLLTERMCHPLGLAHTRISLTTEMRQHLVQGHDLAMNKTRLWNWPAMPGAGCARSTARDLTTFIQAHLGLAPSPLREPMTRMIEVRRPTSLAGTSAGLGWYVTSDGHEEIVWKSGLSAGCNTFMGFSPQTRRGAVLLSNFLWRPIDAGTIDLGIRMIKPDFQSVDFNALYPLN